MIDEINKILYEDVIAELKDKYGVTRDAWWTQGVPKSVRNSCDPYHSHDIEELVAVWLPLTTALNALNSSMGKDDAYPFTLSEPVIAKLGFVHELIAEATRSEGRVSDLLSA